MSIQRKHKIIFGLCCDEICFQGDDKYIRKSAMMFHAPIRYGRSEPHCAELAYISNQIYLHSYILAVPLLLTGFLWRPSSHSESWWFPCSQAQSKLTTNMYIYIHYCPCTYFRKCAHACAHVCPMKRTGRCEVCWYAHTSLGVHQRIWTWCLFVPFIIVI